MEPIFIILIISALGPIIGSAIGVIKKPSERFMFNMLAFAGGNNVSNLFFRINS